MICFSQGNMRRSDISYLLGGSFQNQSAICYVLFHVSFLSLYHSYWQCLRCRLFHQSGLQREDNLKQNSWTCRMTSSMSKINLYCFKLLTNGGQCGNFYQIYKYISPQIYLQNDVRKRCSFTTWFVMTGNNQMNQININRILNTCRTFIQQNICSYWEKIILELIWISKWKNKMFSVCVPILLKKKKSEGVTIYIHIFLHLHKATLEQ